MRVYVCGNCEASTKMSLNCSLEDLHMGVADRGTEAPARTLTRAIFRLVGISLQIRRKFRE